MPAPEPRSSTVSPGCRSARSVGFPQPRLAVPTRVQIVLCLRESKEPVCVCDFTATFSISQPTVSHHMAKLREAGLVDATRQGIWTYYRLKPHLPANIRRIIDALA